MQTRMKNDFIRSAIGSGLEFQSEPSVSLDGLVVVDGGNGIRKSKEVLRPVLIAIQSILHELILMDQHFFDSAFADVSAVFLFTVNRVREIFIVSGDGFRNGA